jgi:membrane-bound ClpP family serine protease
VRYDGPGPARSIDAGTRDQASGAQAREVTQDAAVTQTVQLVQQVLAAPEVAFCLIALGLFAVTMWLAMPALTTAGLVGAVLLVAGGASLAVARTSWAALVVLVLAAASLCFEARFVPGVLYAIWGWFGLTLAGLGYREPGRVHIPVSSWPRPP